jgi:DNA-binding NtrC family response regulator
MQHSVIIASADTQYHAALLQAVKEIPFRVVQCYSLVQLEERIPEGAVSAVILDLDTLPVDNKFLKNLKKKYRDLFVLAVSKKTFHPELKESISSYIYACLAKPVDPEELTFWLRSIHKDKPMSA